MGVSSTLGLRAIRVRTCLLFCRASWRLTGKAQPKGPGAATGVPAPASAPTVAEPPGLGDGAGSKGASRAVSFAANLTPFPGPAWTAEIPANGFFFPTHFLEEFFAMNTKGKQEADSFRLRDSVWCKLEAESILKPGRRGNLFPHSGGRENRQQLRIAMIAALMLDQIDDMYAEVDTLSSAGAEGISDFLKAVRDNRAKDISGPTAAFDAMVAKFMGCLSPDGDMRHTASFVNEDGLAQGSPEFAAALKAHVAAKLDEEKRAKVSASKDELFSIIQAEYPQYIQFLSSSTTEGKEQIVQQAAQRHGEIGSPEEPEGGEGLGAWHLAGAGGAHAGLRPRGASLLDAFAKIREQLTGPRSLGRELQADVSRMATMWGSML